MLGQKSNPGGFGAGEGNGPGGVVAGGGGTGEDGAGNRSSDGRGVRLPASKKLVIAEGSSFVGVAGIFIRLVADLEAVQAITQRGGHIRGFLGGHGGGGGGVVEPIEGLPAGGAKEGGQGIHVWLAHRPTGLAGPGGGPGGVIDAVAADAQQTGAHSAKEADQVGVAAIEQPGGQVRLLVAEADEVLPHGGQDLGGRDGDGGASLGVRRRGHLAASIAANVGRGGQVEGSVVAGV